MKRDITINLEGGCGNQLFQFFGALHIARSQNYRLIVDVSKVNGNRHKGYCIADSKYLNELPDVEFSQLERNSHLLNKIRRISGHQVIAKGVGYPENIASLRKAKELFGYFQTYRFVDDLRSELGWSETEFKQDLNGFLNEYPLDKLIDGDSSLIHIRGGDFHSMANTIGVLSADYFERSLGRFNPRPSKIFVISDESSDLIAKKLGNKFDYQYLPTEDIHPLGIISLISSFERIVVSNSTLSWWGAKLQEKGEIVAPTKWFKELDSPVDLLPSEWHTQDSIWQV